MTSENEEYNTGDSEIAAEDEDKENLFQKYEAQAESAHRAAEETISERNGYNVLVVDDSHAMQQALASELQKLPQAVEIDFADDGESALDKVAKQPIRLYVSGYRHAGYRRL